MFATFLKILLVVAWVYLLTVFKRGKLEFFRFALGSVGLFLVLISFSGYMKQPLSFLFTEALGAVGRLTGLFTGYSRYGMFFIDHKNTAMSLYIDLECSGLIEMMVYTSLMAFFPVYKGVKKAAVWLVGVLFIFIFNIIRVLVIILAIYGFGSQIYAVSHAVIGRLLFYFMVISMYFCVFTKGQLNNQKVGKFTYDGASENVYSSVKEEADEAAKQ